MDVNLAVLFIAGIIAASLGSLVGAGGGFLLIPLLLFLLPSNTSAGIIGGMSLSLALTNGLISSVGYRKQRRIHYKWGLIFASGSITGAIIGATVVQFISRDIYQIIFGTILILLTLYLLVRPAPQTGSSSTTADEGAPPPRIVPGVLLGLPIGFIAGLVGIGGGIVLVPAIVYAFRFVPHIATATSVFTIIFTSLAAILVRTITLNLEAHLIGIMVVVAGALIGGRIGPVLSQKISGQWLMRVLSVALGITGATLTMRGLGVITM